jgi:phage terminase large subunit-like protein
MARTKRVTAADIIAFIETYCMVPEGRFVGRPIKLQDWQKLQLRRIYDNPHGTRRAIWSMGRKNGKTALAACLLLANICGPPASQRPNSQLYSAAQSRNQAGLVFALASKMVRMNPDLNDAILIKDTNKEMICPELGTYYRALSAEATTAFGLSPSFVLHDELGQVRGPTSRLYEALETATGAQLGPLSIILSTQAATDADLLSILIDDAQAAHDVHTVLALYTAPRDADPFDEATIRQANPAFGTFLNATEVMAMAADAKRMKSRENEYRNLILNQRVEVQSPFIQPSRWKACGGVVGDLEDAEVYGGLDLSSVNDLTALVLVGKLGDGRWHVRPTFWLPGEGLHDKAIADRTPYDVWLREGYLKTTAGPTVSYEFVAAHLKTLFDRYKGLKKIGFDRWNFVQFKPWLIKAGLSEYFIKEHFHEFGQGMASMSPALRELEELILNEKLVHGGHPVLTQCVMNTVIVKDDADNRKPSKRRSTGRIDGLVALAMAIGVAPLRGPTIDIEALIA